MEVVSLDEYISKEKEMNKPSLSFNLLWLTVQISLAFFVGFLIYSLSLRGWIHHLVGHGLMYDALELVLLVLFSAPFFYLAVYKKLKEKVIRDQEVLDQYEKFRVILETSPLGAYIYGKTGFLYVSPTFCETLGYDVHQFTGKLIEEVPGLDHETIQKVLENANNRFKNISAPGIYSIPAQKADGTTLTLEIRANLSAFQNERIIVGTIDDITDRTKLEMNLRQSESIYKQLFQSSNDSIILFNLEGKIMEINPAGVELLGYRLREDVINKQYLEMIYPDDVVLVSETFSKALLGESVTIDCRVILENQELKTFSVNAMPYYQHNEIAGVFCLARDITEEKTRELTIQRLALQDDLTGLPNRRHFNEVFLSALLKAEKENYNVALIYMDLDRVKAVNDNLGHMTGDELLKQVGARFKETLRGKGMIARVGGDEFAVILPDYQVLSEVTKTANELLESLMNPFLLNYHYIRVNTSIGVALFPENGQSVKTLLQASDTAMYFAKNQGGNRIQFYDSAMDIRNEEDFYLEHDLALAIEKEEFFLVYQPKVDGETQEIRAAEALVRWKHPAKGVISPAKFIPIAEKTGLIVQLGEWVLREACRQAKEWQKKGIPPLRMAVNISGVQFKQLNVSKLIREILEKTELEAKWLEIEITESVLMDQDEFTTLGLSELKAMGVYISLDDFGTGYSSMKYLNKFRLNALKIDRAFISKINEREEQASITKAILQLGHALGMHVLAEGVETEEELDFLREIGIDELQGYLLSKPLTTSEFENFIKV
jgi:diguanylate cyclase